MQKMMQSDEYDGSGLSLFTNPEDEDNAEHGDNPDVGVLHWDEDAVDLEFKPGKK